MLILRSLLVTLLLAWVTSAAANASGLTLNTIQLKITDRSTSARTTAINQAFDDVLVKMTGYAAVLDEATIRVAAQQATNYVGSYRYIEPPSSDQSLQIAITFDKAALLDLLKQAKQPLWPTTDRPLLLINIETEAKEPLTASAPTAIWHQLHYAANLRGLPTLYLPKLNTDQAPPAWQLDHPALNKKTASQVQQEHHADGLMTLAVTKDRDSWLTRWSLWRQGQSQQWHTSGSDLNLLLQGGIDRATTEFLSTPITKSPPKQTDQREIWLTIMGVDDLATFNKVVKTVQALPAVRSAQISDTGNDGLLLRVKLQGSRSAFIHSLNQIPQLTQQNSYSAQGTLQYQWLDSSANTLDDSTPANTLEFDDF